MIIGNIEDVSEARSNYEVDKTNNRITIDDEVSDFDKLVYIDYNGGYVSVPEDIKGAAMDYVDILHKGSQDKVMERTKNDAITRHGLYSTNDNFPVHIQRILDSYKDSILMTFSLITTIDKKPIDSYVRETRKQRNTILERDLQARRAISNTLESFFTEKVDTLAFSGLYNAVNTSFTLSDFDIDQEYTTPNDIRRAIIQNPAISNQIVSAMQERQKKYFTENFIDGKNRKKRLPIDTSFISIARYKYTSTIC